MSKILILRGILVKKIRRLFKVMILSLAWIIGLCSILLAGYYIYVTRAVSLDESKLIAASTCSLEIFDANDTPIKPSTENLTDISTLSPKTKYAFISAEDKRFYSHSGVDYIRIGGAIISNIKTRSFSEGASTISQQLIKNTQLSSEKTISRKLKEIKLTKALEKKYKKDDILELYLNNIYFGNGCYGIENASLHYFSKSAKDLSLAESAILAGTINAPSIYDIESNPEKANKRKNLILDLMLKYGHISSSECENAKNETVNLNLSKLSSNNYLYNEIIQEACQKLVVSENELKNSGTKIYTYLNLAVQNEISKVIKEKYSSLESSPSVASIITDNETHGIVAIYGNKNTLTSNHQPGSCIKPVLVYAPAIENNIVSPATKILDEKINYSGYCPENADKKYHGMVSVRTALKNSYNVPAVKLLKEVGITDAQNFARKMNINFSEQDNNLAIALGGMTDGITLKTLLDSYTTFANYGYYNNSVFIDKIVKNHKIIYKNTQNNNNNEKIMSDSTAYLITDMLKDSVSSGTAKRLKNFDFEIASKTGTVGLSSSKENTDAYNISYTTKHTLLSYFGGKVMPESINGSTYPTMLTKDILSIIYSKSRPNNFTKPSSVLKVKIDKKLYENENIVKMTSDENNSLTEIFSKSSLPSSTNQNNFSVQVANLKNKKPIIKMTLNDNFGLKLYRREIHELDYIKIFEHNPNDTAINSNNNNTSTFNQIIFEDKTAISGEIYEYFVEFFDKNDKKIAKSTPQKLKVF